jgi:DNA-directed RNA polymerase I, II, and III subunit RPABC2
MKVLTKYEKTRLLGTRALQIAMNAKIFIDPKGEIDPLKIAEMELDQKRIPLKVRRELPNGTVEIYKIDELLIL